MFEEDNITDSQAIAEKVARVSQEIRLSYAKELGFEEREKKEEVEEEKKNPKPATIALNYVGNKAGMQGLDKEVIEAKILELSKGSPYYDREVERTEKAREKA